MKAARNRGRTGTGQSLRERRTVEAQPAHRPGNHRLPERYSFATWLAQQPKRTACPPRPSLCSVSSGDRDTPVSPVKFQREFLRHPGMIGSVVPSIARSSGRTSYAGADRWAAVKTFVEVMAPIVGPLCRRSRPAGSDGTYIAIDTSPDFVSICAGTQLADSRFHSGQGSAAGSSRRPGADQRTGNGGPCCRAFCSRPCPPVGSASSRRPQRPAARWGLFSTYQIAACAPAARSRSFLGRERKWPGGILGALRRLYWAWRTRALYSPVRPIAAGWDASWPHRFGSAPSVGPGARPRG